MQRGLQKENGLFFLVVSIRPDPDNTPFKSMLKWGPEMTSCATIQSVRKLTKRVGASIKIMSGCVCACDHFSR